MKSEFQYTAKVVMNHNVMVKMVLKAAINIEREKRPNFLFLRISSLCLKKNISDSL